MAQQCLVCLLHQISTVTEKWSIEYNEKSIYGFIKAGFTTDQCEGILVLPGNV
jgi:hypothetical protein